MSLNHSTIERPISLTKYNHSHLSIDILIFLFTSLVNSGILDLYFYYKGVTTMNKKLQVFVSSTYTDLKEERQASVEAILDAGHIPAGMELFKAGNESQLKTIYKWIDESDVYMLILGGRYGSVEVNSGKSYTQLEYEYALNKNIPIFSVILSQSFLTNKINKQGLQNIIDTSDKYYTFKSLVMSKIIREVDDSKDIKIAIHSTLNYFLNNYNLTGWVRLETNSKMLNQTEQPNDVERKTNTTKILHNKSITVSTANDQNEKIPFKILIIELKSKQFPNYKTINHKKITALDIFIKNYSKLVNGIRWTYNLYDNDAILYKEICPYFEKINFR